MIPSVIHALAPAEALGNRCSWTKGSRIYLHRAVCDAARAERVSGRRVTCHVRVPVDTPAEAPAIPVIEK